MCADTGSDDGVGTGKEGIGVTILSNVTRWYDRTSRAWIVQGFDPDGNQIGNAFYTGRRADAILTEKEWRTKLGADVRERDLI